MLGEFKQIIFSEDGKGGWVNRVSVLLMYFIDILKQCDEIGLGWRGRYISFRL